MDQQAVTQDQLLKHVVTSLPTEEQLNRVEILVLHRALPELTQRCVSSLIDGTDWPYKLTLYETANYPSTLAKIYNRLLRGITCPYVAFVCSDAWVPRNWLSPLIRVLMADPGVGCCTPLILPPCNPASDLKENSGLHDLRASDLSISVSVFRSAVLLDYGFDERFFLNGHDQDLLLRLESSGYRFRVNTQVVVHHQTASTTQFLYTPEERVLIDLYNQGFRRSV